VFKQSNVGGILMAVGTGVNYELFNIAFFQGVEAAKEIQWFNRKGLLSLDEKRIVEFDLVTNGTVDTYCGYKVKITHKELGEITSHTFYFDDYLRNRQDNRSDYKGGFSIVHHCCEYKGVAEWYIAIPQTAEVRKMANTIFRYVEMYK
jgi:hypothetical protein